MQKITLNIFLLVSFVGIVIGLPRCGPFEKYATLGSSCEIETCEQIGETDRLCPQMVVSGCFCIEGYAKDANGKCIPISECPSPCPTNAEFSEFVTCRSTCRNPRAHLCRKFYTAGCVCKKGYLLSNDGSCIKASSSACQRQLPN